MKPILTLCLWGLLISCFAQKSDSLSKTKTEPEKFPKKVNAYFGSTSTMKRCPLDSLVKLPFLNEHIVGKWEILPNETYNYPLYITHVDFKADRTFKTTFASGPKAKEDLYWYYNGNAIEIYVNDVPGKLRKMYALKVHQINKNRIELELNYTYSPVEAPYIFKQTK